MEKFKVAILCEILRDNSVSPVSYELTSKAKEMTKGIENAEIQIIIVSKRLKFDDIINEFSACGANKIFIVNDDNLTQYSSDKYRKCFCKIIEKEKPQIVLIGATTQGRDLAPLIATTLNTGLTADCTGLEIINGKLEATRPTFGGKLNATILCKTNPQIATVRPSVFPIKKDMYCRKTDVNFNWINTFEEPYFVELLKFTPFEKNNENNLSSAEIILAGGKGLKTKENFDLLYELADLLNASVAASRGAVDLGFADSNIQVGQTGKTVRAKVYVTFGISGAIQHVAGINSCDKIIAINSDIDAPIFKFADVGIHGDAIKIIKSMIKNYKTITIGDYL